MYKAGHEVVSVLAFMGVIQLSYVGFSQPSSRKQLWRYLNKLSTESSSIQWCYELCTISVPHGLTEMINEVTKLRNYLDLPKRKVWKLLDAWNHCYSNVMFSE